MQSSKAIRTSLFSAAESKEEKKIVLVEKKTDLKAESAAKSKSKNFKKLHQIIDIATDANYFAFAAVKCVVENRSLRSSFFKGSAIYSHIPHVPSRYPFGHIHFTRQETDKFTAAALSTPNGIATYWAGPAFPVIYVASNDARLELVRESHMGIVDDVSENHLKRIYKGNNVMCTFTDFRNIFSNAYKMQRKFLVTLFHHRANLWLPDTVNATERFLNQYCKEQGRNPRSLRDFLTALVLYTSSHLLGLTQSTLDLQYFKDPVYRNAIGRVAKYGISERADPDFEETLYKIFLQILGSNFEQTRDGTPETNLIQNIFASMDVPFPQEFDDFFKLQMKVRHEIAMNFSAIALAGMVHSTANSLDWAVARLLRDPSKMSELGQLMAEHKDLDLTDERLFDKEGPLFPINEWVLHNVFLYPTFSHEFFLNRKSFTANLSDRSTINVPSMSLIVVNYAQCNRSNKTMADAKTFSESLSEKATTSSFIFNDQVASFGGSKSREGSRKSRRCPGANTSLGEQMVIISILLRDYSLQLTELKENLCDVDQSEHPVLARLKNVGNVVLTKRIIPESVADVKKLLSQARSRDEFQYIMTDTVFNLYSKLKSHEVDEVNEIFGELIAPSTYSKSGV